MPNDFPFKPDPPDILVEATDQVDVKLVASIAEQILITLHQMRLSPLTRHSILTTCFMNNMKLMVRDSPEEFFQMNRNSAIELLTRLVEEMESINPGVADARRSEDDPGLPGRKGSSD
jgi:hypothetical protein